MSLEGFSKKGMELGNNPEQIYETKNDLRQQYLNAIKRLALQKMKNDLLFEGSLGAAMRRLSSLGLDVSKESMLKDIETEVTRQRMSFDIEMPNVSIEEPNVNVENQSQIEQLNINLRSIFESAPVREQQKQMKDQIISQIMVGMNNAGEFTFGDISLGERMNIMQNVQNTLNSKSMDELQMILSTYKEQNVQEENMSSGMRR